MANTVNVIQSNLETAQERTMRLMQQAAQAIGGAMAQRRAQQERELNLSVEMMAKNPRLAKTLGADLVQKHGKRYPWLSGVVQSISEQAEQEEKGKVAYGGFLEQVEELGQGADELERTARSMPPQIPMPGPPGAPPMMMPNPIQQQAIQQIGAVRQSPEMMMMAAAQQYGQRDPTAWLAARNYANAQGLDFPQLDPSQLPAEVRAAQMRQFLTPEAKKAADVAAKIAMPAGAMSKADELAERERAADERVDLTARLRAEQAKLSETAKKQAAEVAHAHRMTEIAARGEATTARELAKEERKKAKGLVPSGKVSEHLAAINAAIKPEFGEPKQKPVAMHVAELLKEAKAVLDQELGGQYDQQTLDAAALMLREQYIEGLKSGLSSKEARDKTLGRQTVSAGAEAAGASNAGRRVLERQ